jgi:hypothetical protein
MEEKEMKNGYRRNATRRVQEVTRRKIVKVVNCQTGAATKRIQRVMETKIKVKCQTEAAGMGVQRVMKRELVIIVNHQRLVVQRSVLHVIERWPRPCPSQRRRESKEGPTKM